VAVAVRRVGGWGVLRRRQLEAARRAYRECRAFVLVMCGASFNVLEVDCRRGPRRYVSREREEQNVARRIPVGRAGPRSRSVMVCLVNSRRPVAPPSLLVISPLGRMGRVFTRRRSAVPAVNVRADLRAGDRGASLTFIAIFCTSSGATAVVGRLVNGDRAPPVPALACRQRRRAVMVVP